MASSGRVAAQALDDEALRARWSTWLTRSVGDDLVSTRSACCRPSAWTRPACEREVARQGEQLAQVRRRAGERVARGWRTGRARTRGDSLLVRRSGPRARRPAALTAPPADGSRRSGGVTRKVPRRDRIAVTALRNTGLEQPTLAGGKMAVWMPQCGVLRDVTDVATDVEVLAPDDVRDFVAAHGGRLFVWVSVHRGFPYTLCLLETSLEPPRQARPLIPAHQGAGLRRLSGGPRSGSGRRRWSSPCAGGAGG